MHEPWLAPPHVGLYCPVGHDSHAVVAQLLLCPLIATVIVTDVSVVAVGARPHAGAGAPGVVQPGIRAGGAGRRQAGAARGWCSTYRGPAPTPS